MARVGFTAENKAEEIDYKYPKLWLERGEVARIIVGLESPQREFVHTLERPVVANGQLQTTFKQGRGEEQIEVIKTQFVTKAICLGDAAILENSGVDPKNCPMCKLATDYPDQARPPYRRYAMHVFRYDTVSPSKFEVSEPFGGKLVVWAFPDRTFNKLVDFAQEHGDLRQKDLLLGPCENKDWQKFDIQIGSKAEWLLSDSRKQRVAETFKHNQIPDLTVAIGTPKKEAWIRQDIQSVINAWAQVSGTADALPENRTSLDEDLSQLLESPVSPVVSLPETSNPVTVVSEESTPVGLGDLDEFLSAPAVQSAGDSEPTPVDISNFDDLIDSL